MTNHTYLEGLKGSPLTDQCSGLIEKLVFQQFLCPQDVAGRGGGDRGLLDLLLLGLVIENFFKPESMYVLKSSYSYSAHFCGFLDSFARGR
jgi:hypothetical protein